MTQKNALTINDLVPGIMLHEKYMWNNKVVDKFYIVTDIVLQDECPCIQWYDIETQEFQTEFISTFLSDENLGSNVEIIEPLTIV